MKSRPSLKDWDKNFMELKSDLESLRECLKNLFLALPDCQIWQVLEQFLPLGLDLAIQVSDH